MESKLNDLLNKDDNSKTGGASKGESEQSDQKEKDQGGPTQEELKRGPRIGDDVQVKICDMGNGCWTYHHFTPEI